MRTLLVIPVLLASGIAGADPLRATLVDGITLEPIPHATARVNGRTVTANVRGEVVVDGLDRAVDVEAFAPGYESAIQNVGLGGDSTLVLLFKPDALERIEVRGHAPGSKTSSGYLITRGEIENLPGGSRDALAAVRSLPGVSAAPPIAGGRLVIRGGAPHDSLLTIDGVPVPFVYHAFDQATILPVSMIGAIAYSPGGFGVDEGRATSGLVAITTNDNLPTKPTAIASLSMLDVSAAAATPLRRGLTLSGGIRRSTVDMLLPLVVSDDDQFAFTTPPRYYDAQLRLDWVASPRDRVNVLALTSYDRGGIVNRIPDSELPSDFELDTKFARLMGSWKHETAGVRNRMVVALGTGTFNSRLDTIQHIDDVELLALARDDLSVDVSPWLRVRTGALAQFQRHDLDASSIVLPTEPPPPGAFDTLPIKTIKTTFDTSYAAAYAAAELQPSEATTITAGARVDYFARIDAAVFEPRIELAHKTGTMTLRAAAGRYARDHAQTQALATNLLPEVATQVSGGTEIKLADGLVATATVYHTRRDQLAVDDPGRMTAPNELPFASTGRGASTGVDLLLRYARDNMFAWLSYSWSNTSRRDRPGELAHATAFDQTHALTAVASWRLGAWQLGGRFSLATGLPYTDVVGATYSDQFAAYLPMFGAPYGVRYPDAIQVDLRVERTWKTKHVELAAYVDLINAFRNDHIYRYTYSADFQKREPNTQFVPLPSLGVRGTF